ncbi:3-hydroxyacyl-CoA dehydrogenase family protein [Streptomyces sp. MS1.AVA.1]|uniref:3-hydroxyacyl-CoA dehydrogenase family protein n=2 Tax=Streptomyces TaxID=1883 RepID=A0ABU8UUV9_9ACTN
MLTLNEAIFVLHEGVSSAADIDRLFKECFGHAMGPLETADLIGLDTVLLSLEVLYGDFNDPKYRPCPLLRRLVDAGLHGRKTGQGFHSYERSNESGSGDMAEDDKHLIREFISTNMQGVPVDDDEDLFASGYVNSLFAVQLVMWIERTFDFQLVGKDLDFANFSTIDAIAAFVDGKRTLAGGGAWTSN